MEIHTIVFDIMHVLLRPTARGYEEDQELLDFIAANKSRYKFYALTDATRVSMEQGKDALQLFQVVEEVFYSEDFNVGKSNPKIYNFLCEKLKIENQASIFIDDKEGNCEAANMTGFNTIVHTDAATTLAKIQQLLTFSAP